MCEAESDDKKCFFLFHVTLELFTLPVLIYLEVEEHDARVLHRALDGPQEGDSLSSVNESMVVGESDVHHGLAHHLRGKNRSDSYMKQLSRGIYLAVAHHRPLKSPVHPEDGRLRRVDDGGSKERSEDAAVRDRECSTIHVLHCQLIVFGLLAEGGDTLLDVGVVHVVHVPQDRYDEALEGRYVDLQ